jgi:hypothetical protein
MSGDDDAVPDEAVARTMRPRQMRGYRPVSNVDEPPSPPTAPPGAATPANLDNAEATASGPVSPDS